MWLLRSRFAKFELTPWEKFTVALQRAKRSVFKAVCAPFNVIFAPLLKRREAANYRRHLEQSYPLIDRDAPPPGRWVADEPSVTRRRWEGMTQWRTQHGPASVCWMHGKPRLYAWNIRIPDGSRRDLRDSMQGWRRRADPPNAWTYGELILTDDDVEFSDFERQPQYTAPPISDLPSLEADLANSNDFIAALQDDVFAMFSYHRLCNMDWFKIGTKDYIEFEGNRAVAHMIAGLRGKGEEYLDVQNGMLSGSAAQTKPRDLERHASFFDNSLRQLGWRTHTQDEITAALQEDLRQRLRGRVQLLRDIKEYERRPLNLHPVLDQSRPRAWPMTLFEGDDLRWLGTLNSEETEAISGKLSDRIFDMAVSGRITQSEHDSLRNRLFGFRTFLGSR